VAPIFHVAKVVRMWSRQFGRTIATMSPTGGPLAEAAGDLVRPTLERLEGHLALGAVACASI